MLPAPSNVVVPDIGKVGLFVLALDGLAFAVDHGVLCDNAVLGRVRLDDLELDRTSSSSCDEGVALSHGAVGLEEVGLDEDVEEVSGQALNAVVKGQDVDPLAVLDVVAWVDGGDISELYSQVVPSHLVELNLALIDIVG